MDEEDVFIDGSHVKANANNHRYQKAKVAETARYYEEELRKEIAKDREEHGLKPLKENEKKPKLKEIKVSTTDPDSGVFHKGEHKKVFAYTANVACDKHGYILDAEVTAGNLHNSVVFPRLYRRLKEEFPKVQNIVVDAGYKTPAIAREIIEDGKTPVMPYKRPMTKKEFFRKSDYIYDEYYDCYLCPNESVLKYSTTNRDGYREYKSDAKICKDCPHRVHCTLSKNRTKVVTRHVWEEYLEQAEDIRHTIGMKEVYAKRKETIERVFAGAKELHGMRYAKHRGIQRVRMELILLFACMNLKKLAVRLWEDSPGTALLSFFQSLFHSFSPVLAQ